TLSLRGRNPFFLKQRQYFSIGQRVVVNASIVDLSAPIFLLERIRVGGVSDDQILAVHYCLKTPRASFESPIHPHFAITWCFFIKNGMMPHVISVVRVGIDD